LSDTGNDTFINSLDLGLVPLKHSLFSVLKDSTLEYIRIGPGNLRKPLHNSRFDQAIVESWQDEVAASEIEQGARRPPVKLTHSSFQKDFFQVFYQWFPHDRIKC